MPPIVLLLAPSDILSTSRSIKPIVRIFVFRIYRACRGAIWIEIAVMSVQQASCAGIPLKYWFEMRIWHGLSAIFAWNHSIVPNRGCIFCPAMNPMPTNHETYHAA